MRRVAELLAIFVGLPILFYFGVLPLRVLTTLWGFAGLGFYLLLRDPSFESAKLFRFRDHNVSTRISTRVAIRRVFLRFVVCASLLTAVCWWIDAPWFLSLIRERPRLWALIMVLYPILSVFPQGIIYRVFFVHRYRELVPEGWPMVTAGALAFAFSHIVFGNPVAIGLTLIGGLLFTKTYQETQSGGIASLEHALYGCMVITLGMGHFLFYRGG